MQKTEYFRVFGYFKTLGMSKNQKVATYAIQKAPKAHLKAFNLIKNHTKIRPINSTTTVIVMRTIFVFSVMTMIIIIVLS